MNSFPDAADAESPLKPAELQVLRAQYEKEGEYVSLQTKFNYAWVCGAFFHATFGGFIV
jgi:fission 1 protein